LPASLLLRLASLCAESKRIEIKMEAYNLTNSFWWGNPIMTAAALGTSQFGRSFRTRKPAAVNSITA
jgi:hypothetical protein